MNDNRQLSRKTPAAAKTTMSMTLATPGSSAEGEDEDPDEEACGYDTTHFTKWYSFPQ